MSLFHHFLNFINLLIYEKVIDFFTIIFFFFITFFLSFPFYSPRFSRSPRYNKTYAKINKTYDNIYDNSFYLLYLFRLLRLPRYDKIYNKTYAETYVKIDKTYDNTCGEYYCYNKEKFNNINKLNIKVFFPPLSPLLYFIHLVYLAIIRSAIKLTLRFTLKSIKPAIISVINIIIIIKKNLIILINLI